jgi:hypothetical protein
MRLRISGWCGPRDALSIGEPLIEFLDSLGVLVRWLAVVAVMVLLCGCAKQSSTITTSHGLHLKTHF